MCRWIFYTGPELPLADLITRPKHSLIHQSYHARMRDEPLNGDGFGLAWFPSPEVAAHLESPGPAAFRSIQPAWNDLNLRHLARVTTSRTILAHVRAASPGLGVSQFNCHPFLEGDWAFMHNGLVGDFIEVKRDVHRALSDARFQNLRGTTDSEHLFALALDTLGEDDDLEAMGAALLQVIERVEGMQRERGITAPNTFNLCLTNGRETAITRYARGKPAESLFLHTGARYLCDGDECRMLPTKADERGAVLVASEPLGDDEWQAIPEQSLLLVRADRTVETRPIPPFGA